MSSADHHSGRQPDKGVNILLQLQDWINPVVRCCQPMKAVDKQPSADAPVMAPISVSNGLSDVANPPRVLQHVRLSDEPRRHQTAKLLQYIEAEHTDGRLNAMREGIWSVKGYDGGSKVHFCPCCFEYAQMLTAWNRVCPAVSRYIPFHRAGTSTC